MFNMLQLVFKFEYGAEMFGAVSTRRRNVRCRTILAAKCLAPKSRRLKVGAQTPAPKCPAR